MTINDLLTPAMSLRFAVALNCTYKNDYENYREILNKIGSEYDNERFIWGFDRHPNESEKDYRVRALLAASSQTATGDDSSMFAREQESGWGAPENTPDEYLPILLTHREWLCLKYGLFDDVLPEPVDMTLTQATELRGIFAPGADVLGMGDYGTGSRHAGAIFEHFLGDSLSKAMTLPWLCSFGGLSQHLQAPLVRMLSNEEHDEQHLWFLVDFSIGADAVWRSIFDEVEQQVRAWMEEESRGAQITLKPAPHAIFYFDSEGRPRSPFPATVTLLGVHEYNQGDEESTANENRRPGRPPNPHGCIRTPSQGAESLDALYKLRHLERLDGIEEDLGYIGGYFIDYLQRTPLPPGVSPLCEIVRRGLNPREVAQNSMCAFERQRPKVFGEDCISPDATPEQRATITPEDRVAIEAMISEERPRHTTYCLNHLYRLAFGLGTHMRNSEMFGVQVGDKDVEMRSLHLHLDGANDIAQPEKPQTDSTTIDRMSSLLLDAVVALRELRGAPPIQWGRGNRGSRIRKLQFALAMSATDNFGSQVVIDTYSGHGEHGHLEGINIHNADFEKSLFLTSWKDAHDQNPLGHIFNSTTEREARDSCKRHANSDQARRFILSRDLWLV